MFFSSNDPDDYEHLTQSRKLKLEEYDFNGNLVNVREFSKSDLFAYCQMLSYDGRPLEVARTPDIDTFSREQLELIKKIYLLNLYQPYLGNNTPVFLFTQREVLWFKNIFSIYSMDDF
jgi:hypothetical protein